MNSRGARIAAAGAAFSGRGRLFCSNHPGLTRPYLPTFFFGKLHRSPPGRRSVRRLVAGLGWRPIIWVCEAEGGNSGGRRTALLFAREVANIVVIPAAARTPGIRGIRNNELQAQRACRRLQVCDAGLGRWSGRVDENAEHGSIRYQLVEQLQMFRRQLGR